MARDVAADEALIGRTIAGKYRIDEFVGGGAMGAVYKAKQIALEKVVAIKVLHREIQKDAQFAARFKREAKAASRLDHESSMRVLDFGEESDGLLYMVMEYLDGHDLFEVHRTSFPLPSERIAAILTQALAALAVAHDMGVIHRDLKPENIMVLAGHDDEGRPKDVVKVCDFGIAKIVDAGRASVADSSAARLSTRGLVVGTPEYMSPEQGRGEPLDPRADLYSVGVILYQLITGKVPFEAESAIGIVLKHVTEEPKPPHELRSDVDPRLERIALKAMQKKKEDRFQSAREMRAALRQVIEAPSPSSSNPNLGATPSIRIGPIESAATVPFPIGAEEPKATLAAAELAEPVEIPRKRVPLALVALVTLVVGALGTIAAISLRRPVAAGEPADSAGAASVASTATATAPASASASASASAGASAAPLASTARPKPTAVVTGPPTGAPQPSVAAPKASAEVIDVEHAGVAVVAVRAEGASEPVVRGAVDVARASSCYKDGLRGPGARGQLFQQTLQLQTDAAGNVTMAAMPAPTFLSGFQLCYVQKLIGAKIAGASNAKIEVDMRFSPR